MRRAKSQHKQRTGRKKGKDLLSLELRKSLLLILLTLAVLLGFRLAWHEFVHKRQSPLLAAKWQLYSPGQLELSLLLPSEPQPGSFVVPATDAEGHSVERYQASVKEFRVMIWSVLHQAAASVEHEQSRQSLPAVLQAFGEVAEYKETSSQANRANQSRALVAGTFSRNGEPMQFRALLLSEAAKQWRVLISYPVAYPAATKAAQQIIDSVNVTKAKTPL